ncbi:MAG: SPASM domain-containing protein [Planctomycetota bacterium]|nr:SPASM domain-containing protein [Planctomycetota bacterium]
MSRTFGAIGRLLRLGDRVRLRREHFGGIAFEAGTGTTVDVDRPVFAALDYLRLRGVQGEEALVQQLCGRKQDAGQFAEAHRLLSQLEDLAILAPASEAEMQRAAGAETAESEASQRPDARWPQGPHLTAPVTVHWAVTYECTSQCPECYVRRYAHGFPGGLTLPESLRLVEILANWGVFELAIGCGEPLEFPLLPAIVREARRQGLMVHVTTGLHRVPAARLEELAEGITGLQIGVKADRLLGNPSVEVAALAETTTAAGQTGLHVGANLILSQQTLPHFEKLLDLLQQAGLRRVTLLRYKPPADVAEWRRAKLPAKSLREFESRLPEVLRRHPDIALRLDCALSFLQRHLGAAEALAQGLRGCVAGHRILALAPDGSAFPCSQLVHPRFCAGNLLGDPIEEFWAKSPVLRRYRLFRSKVAFQATACGLCAARDHCGGCRVFAADGWGEEPECPGPRVPRLNQLGKAGRRWDLERYLRSHGSISVRDYMQRYGVGQKRAIAELRAFGYFLVSGTGRKQSDLYQGSTEDVIGDIQDMIGCTTGGVPFASREEIAGWIGDERGEMDDHYPRWLRRQLEDDLGELEHYE